MTCDPNCVFCKIVAGELPSTRVLETDRAIAILDINPVVKGHVLIIPRDHHPRLDDLPDDLAAHAGSLLPRLTRAIVGAVGAEGLNTVINNGAVAGQVVDHCHWHLIPRFASDAVDWTWPHDTYETGEAARIAARIVDALA